MNRLRTYFSCLTLMFTLAFVSCEKLEIPNDEHDNNKEQKGDATTEQGGAGNGEIQSEKAYSVSDIINRQYTKTNGVYVEGYIVGYVSHTTMASCHFSRGDVETNILIAATPVDTFANKCIPVQLTTSTIPCKATRTALNLAYNDVLGQKVRLQGDIDYYMGTFGLLKARNHTLLENDFDEGEHGQKDETVEDDTEGDDTDGAVGDKEDEEQEDGSETDSLRWADLEKYIESHGTPDAPYTIADFKTSLPEYLSHFGAQEVGHPGIKDVCICGYIVGYVPKGNSKIEKTVFDCEGAVQTNIVLADSPEEQDFTNCIAVALSLSPDNAKKTRKALNLADNPDNYKRRFIILGNITDSKGYMGTLGLKNARDYMPCDDE